MSAPAKSHSSFLEIAAFNFESAHRAIKAGADRIEYCSNRDAGGLTPENVDDVASLRNIQGPLGQVPVNVMIRCNEDFSFLVSEAELVGMKKSILEYKPYAAGFVFGVLTPGGAIDFAACQTLVELASPLPCTFHRAFDYATPDIPERLRLVARCGFKRILSSGGPHDAVKGKEALKLLVQEAKSIGVEIIIGGGVRSDNVRELIEATGASIFHTAATYPGSDEVDIEQVARIREAMEPA